MRKSWLLWVLCGLLLAGCGGKENDKPAGAGNAGAGQELLVAQEVSQGKTLTVKDVEVMHFEEPEEGYAENHTCYRIIGPLIYMLRVESGGEDKADRLCMQIYDVEEKELTQQVITPQVQGHEGCRIYSADLTADLELSLKMRDGENRYFLLKTDLEGNTLEVSEPFPEEGYPWNLDFWDNTKSFWLPDGRIILSRYDDEGQRTILTRLDEEGKEFPLGELPGDYVNSLLADGENTFYYQGGNSLVRWDMEKNTREELFRMYENGVDPGAEASGLIRNQRGEILLCRLQRGKGTLYVLTDEELPLKEQIRLVSLEGEAGIYYFQRRVAGFKQNGGEIPIALELENRPEYEQDYRDRIMAEMAAGKGPDILYVNRDDMMLLQERGALCDLSDMIPQETKDVLIPGALGLGTVDGQLVGLVLSVEFRTMATSFEVWEGDGWNLEELMGVLESREDWKCPFLQKGVQLSRYDILYELLFRGDSSLLNLEQGSCGFDSPEFVRLLELCKKYGSTETLEKRLEGALEQDECLELMQEGEAAVQVMHSGGLDGYSIYRQWVGEEGHVVGFPAEEGSGSYVESYSQGYLVVNAQSAYKEEIGKFFSLLLNYDNQFQVDEGSVRTDVIRDSVYYHPWRECYVLLRSSDAENRVITDLTLKPDGSTYLEEYLDFVESCRPVPYIPMQIRLIVQEEAHSFFEGSKGAVETAEAIQSRVQLYLEEKK